MAIFTSASSNRFNAGISRTVSAAAFGVLYISPATPIYVVLQLLSSSFCAHFETTQNSSKYNADEYTVDQIKALYIRGGTIYKIDETYVGILLE